MKTLTSLVAASVLLIGASAAQAYDFERHTKETTATASSSAEAYKLGTNKIAQLQSASPRALYNELGLYSPDAIETSTRLNDGAFVTIQERMSANGQLGYVGLVNIDVSYNEDDQNDND